MVIHLVCKVEKNFEDKSSKHYSIFSKLARIKRFIYFYDRTTVICTVVRHLISLSLLASDRKLKKDKKTSSSHLNMKSVVLKNGKKTLFFTFLLLFLLSLKFFDFFAICNNF